MKIKSVLAPAAAGLALVSTLHAVSIVEDFSHDPALDGWQVFGDASLFQWDRANHNLRVTWDSSRPNSYFYHPLGMILGRSNDFSVSFDLLLNDYAIGVNPAQPDTFELAAGFLNFAQATSPDFFRGGYPSQPDLAEFDFFQWDNDFSTNSVDPTFVDSANTFADSEYGIVEMPTGMVMRVTLNFTASNQTAVLTVTTNGAAVVPSASVNLDDATYGVFGNLRLDTFAVESYSGAMAYGSLLAHGAIGNVLLVVPPPLAISSLALVNGAGRVQFASQTNWDYVLQTSADLQTWLPAGPVVGGTGGNLILQDTNSPRPYQFYRVSAQPADQ